MFTARYELKLLHNYALCGDWMELAQDRESWRALVSTVRNLRVP